ncbi:Pentatricopeptide repeat-containing protein [Artemisia annua]|uniref:Pentatricopeptide repeat-containing protein n=1 Tax=Artemisia annua TaxID=35608 RepID=A0A2U1NUD1_ARTAN|nr:Pentatricopeptide repeat-containing protein [Artemisia annua]
MLSVRLDDRYVVFVRAKYTFVIRYFCTHSRFQEAFALYVELQTSGFVPSTFSVASALSSWNAMISGYVECGKVGLARNFYNSMPERNSISCITMIGGYSKCGDVESARELFSKMDRKDHLL